VPQSPVAQLLAAIDKLDLEAVMAMFAPDVRLLTIDGRHAEGPEEARDVLAAYLDAVRSTQHEITAEWHQDDVWIAEVTAGYELRDWTELGDRPRVFILREGPDGVTDLRVYGAHELPLSEHRTGEDGLRIGDRWIPPL
jgi:hypothetical protein